LNLLQEKKETMQQVSDDLAAEFISLFSSSSTNEGNKNGLTYY
jgi:hypothetical protein